MLRVTKFRNQQGFIFVEVIIIAVVIAVFGFIIIRMSNTDDASSDPTEWRYNFKADLDNFNKYTSEKYKFGFSHPVSWDVSKEYSYDSPQPEIYFLELTDDFYDKNDGGFRMRIRVVESGESTVESEVLRMAHSNDACNYRTSDSAVGWLTATYFTANCSGNFIYGYVVPYGELIYTIETRGVVVNPESNQYTVDLEAALDSFVFE